MTPRQVEIEEARKERPLVMGVVDGRWQVVSSRDARQEEIRVARENME